MVTTVLLNVISIYLLLGALYSVSWAVHVRTLNGSGYPCMLLLLSLALCVYLSGYAFELNAESPSQILFWDMVSFLGAPFMPALWLMTVMIYTGRYVNYRKSAPVAVFAIPLILLILRLTNDWHHLFYLSLDYVQIQGHLFLVKQMGPGQYALWIYSFVTVALALGLFAGDSAKRETWQRGKTLLVGGGSCLAAAGLVLAAIRPVPFLDYMALIIPVVSVFIVCAIARYDFLETRAIARNKVFEASTNAILLIDRQYKILDYNERARTLFSPLGIRLCNGYVSSVFRGSDELVEALESVDPTVLTLRVDDERRHYRVTTQDIDETQSFRGWIKTLCDITDMHNLNGELRQQALTDELSMLSNRRAFMAVGTAWVTSSEVDGESLHLLIMDLDHFKSINDRYGHPVGDLVIREFSHMMKGYFCSECLVARLGGEEFAVMRRGLETEAMTREVSVFMDTARQKVYRYEDIRFQVTVSIGMTRRGDGQTLESMMRRADKALYDSKGQGRNRLVVR